MKILTLPKYVFDTKITDEYISNNKNIIFISILDEDNTEKRYGQHDNLLIVRFWDIEQDVVKNGVIIYKAKR